MHLPKGQLISKGLFGLPKNERKISATVGWGKNLHFQVQFLGELKLLKFPFEINWPLAARAWAGLHRTIYSILGLLKIVLHPHPREPDILSSNVWAWTWLPIPCCTLSRDDRYGRFKKHWKIYESGWDNAPFFSMVYKFFLWSWGGIAYFIFNSTTLFCPFRLVNSMWSVIVSTTTLLFRMEGYNYVYYLVFYFGF